MESDWDYFEFGADIVALEGANLAVMTGLEPLAGAVVVQRVAPEAVGDPRRWVLDIDQRLRSIGATMARVYLGDRSGVPSSLEAALWDRGHRPRVEIGYVVVGAIPAGAGVDPGPEVTLRPVSDEVAWELKHKLHAGSDVASDGHASPAEEWVELERRKCETGGMEAFLVEVGGEVCGAVATLAVPSHGLLRAKNVFVHPEWRRRRVATQVMRALSLRALDLGLEATGIFGVEGNPGNALYLSLAMTPVVRQVEWSKPLESGGP